MISYVAVITHWIAYVLAEIQWSGMSCLLNAITIMGFMILFI